MIVLDASAALELLLRAGDHPGLVDRVLRSAESIAAPHLLDLEVAQVLRRFVLNGDLSEALGIVRYPHDALLPRVWQLRANCTAYDAVYLALAEALESPLVTFDSRIAAVPGHAAAVEVLRR